MSPRQESPTSSTRAAGAAPIAAAGDTRIILNPAAGTGRGRERLRRVLRSELPGGELCETAARGDGRRLAEEAAREGCGTVVAAGGDGLAGEVADGLLAAGGRPRLGILPIGTGNDLARALGVPMRPEAAARALAGARTRRIDAGWAAPRVGGEGDPVPRHFVNAVVAGFGARIQLQASTKRLWRGAAYLREGLARLGDLRPHPVRVRVADAEGEEELAEECYLVVVANGGSMGGGIRAAPGARLDDGLLDVVAVRVQSLPALARTLSTVLFRRSLPEGGTWRRRGRAVSIEADPPLWLNVDGEVVGRGDVDLRALPGALRVLSPGGS